LLKARIFYSGRPNHKLPFSDAVGDYIIYGLLILNKWLQSMSIAGRRRSRWGRTCHELCI